MKYIFLILIASFTCAGELISQPLQWRLIPSSPSSSSRFEDVFFINENTGWIVHYDGETYKTTNGGSTWTEHNNIALNRSVGFFTPEIGIIGTLDSARTLYRTTNGGVNYVQISNSNLPNPKPKGVCGISILNSNTAFACGTYHGFAKVLKTTNQGASWTTIFSDTSLARTLIDCLFWSADSGIAVGGYNRNDDYQTSNAVVIITTNGGNSWQRVFRSARSNEWCWKISFFSRTSGYVSIERFSGFAYILKTTNGGFNWSEIPFRDYDVEGIGFINENTGWVGGWTGPTWQTTNGGTNWQMATWGFFLNRFRFLNDTLAYSVGQRVYKFSRTLTSIQSDNISTPDFFKLNQNFPNPFNPETLIKYELKTHGHVKIIVFGNLGNEISTLVDEELSSGSYEINFAGNDLPSGIYFYQMTVNGVKIGTKQMVLLK